MAGKNTFLLIAAAFLGWGLFVPLHAQDTGFRRIAIIPVQASLVASDALYQLYIVTPDGEIQKYDPAGNLLFRQSNKRLGEISLLDVTNPMNPFVYHADFQLIRLMERTLSPAGQVPLNDAGIIAAQAVCLSGDNKIWVYDPLDFQILKLSLQGEEVFRTGNLQLLLNYNLQPVYMLERDQRLMLSDPQQGIFVFDVFGKYIRTIPLKGLEQFAFSDDRIIYAENGQMKLFDWRTGEEKSFPMPPAYLQSKKIVLFPRRLFLVGEHAVEVFEY